MGKLRGEEAEEAGYKFNKCPKKPMTPYTYYAILKKKEVKRVATKGGAAKKLTNSWNRVTEADTRPPEVCTVDTIHEQ